METDLIQVLVFCLVMLEQAAKDVSLLERTRVAPAQLDGSSGHSRW
ncbi:MAG: hypothetical protein JJU21_01270 [Salinarimonas sp.]|nr:hypothetical protein [Salinarimonas sp.]